MSAHLFSHAVRVLLCNGCGGPLEVDLGAPTATCTYCGASNVLAVRDESSVAAPTTTPVDEPERLVRLRRQVGKPLLPPPTLAALVPHGRVEPWKLQEVFAVWQSTREEARATKSFDAAERLLYLTMVLANHHSRDDRLRQRAMFESALVVVQLPRHRQVLRGYLSRAATREGDLEAAEAWLQPCDTASDDLDTDSAWRLSRGYLDTAKGDWDGVLRALGRTADAVPIADASAPMAVLLRAHATERSGNTAGAVALLREAMSEGAAMRATLDAIRAAHPDWKLCPGTFAQAEAAHTAVAAKSAGGVGAAVGGTFYWVGIAMNLVSLACVAALGITGVGALGLGLIPLAVRLRSAQVHLINEIAGGLGAAAFTFAMVLPTTLPIGIIFFLIGRGLRNAARRAERLRLHGRRATGSVVSVTPTGTTINDVPQMQITLRVELPDAAPYEAKTTMLLNPVAAARLASGGTVPLRVDPDDRSQVLIETD